MYRFALALLYASIAAVRIDTARMEDGFPSELDDINIIETLVEIENYLQRQAMN